MPTKRVEVNVSRRTSLAGRCAILQQTGPFRRFGPGDAVTASSLRAGAWLHRTRFSRRRSKHCRPRSRATSRIIRAATRSRPSPPIFLQMRRQNLRSRAFRSAVTSLLRWFGRLRGALRGWRFSTRRRHRKATPPVRGACTSCLLMQEGRVAEAKQAHWPGCRSSHAARRRKTLADEAAHGGATRAKTLAASHRGDHGPCGLPADAREDPRADIGPRRRRRPTDGARPGARNGGGHRWKRGSSSCRTADTWRRSNGQTRTAALREWLEATSS